MGQQLPNYCNYQTWSEDTISKSNTGLGKRF
ncbi:hypothetical protein T02_9693 [Trichinella nativa]|nr:hypothetical protein T02_9693 [Trichinella nativa]